MKSIFSESKDYNSIVWGMLLLLFYNHAGQTAAC